MESCPICFEKVPLQLLERHVNICLDTAPAAESADVDEKTPSKRPSNPFAALGLKVDSKKSLEKPKKTNATLTSILLAEKKLNREKRSGELQSHLLRIAQAEAEFSREIKTPPVDLEANASEENTPRVPASAQPRESSSPSHVATEENRTSSQISESRKENHQEKTPSKLDLLRQKQQEVNQLKREAELPLAQRLRPKSLDDFHGQEHLVGENGILRNFIHSDNIPSFILWGVPGVGKTSLARIIASSSNHKFVELSGADSNAKKLREVFTNAQNHKNLSGQRTILFLDEIHRFNKAVQDLLLPVIEKGTLSVIGATTENPSFTLNNALLSRMHTFVMNPLPQEALARILNRGLLILNKTRKLVHGLHLIALNRESIDYIAHLSTGDSRTALNILESVNAYLSGLQFRQQSKEEEGENVVGPAGVIKITLKELKPMLKSRNFHQMYDRQGDNHYDTISAFHKSIRGSDENAALFYLVKMLHGGEDPLFIARRMIVIASEDVGLRDSTCLPFAIAALEALQFIGMPEGEIVLAHCTLKLARAPKSTKSYRALRSAQALFLERPDVAQLPVPLHLRNAPTNLMKDLGFGEKYKYNPNFKHGLAKQKYLPSEVSDLQLVEDTHLGDVIDEQVDENEYKRADHEQEEYRKFKKARIHEIQQQMANHRKKTSKKTKQLIDCLSSEPNAERLSSYDENLSKDDQPDYFDGSERDDYYEEEVDQVENMNDSMDG